MFAILSAVTIGVNACMTAKNAITLYNDTRRIKREYVETRRTKQEYKNISQDPLPILTDSQFQIAEQDFIIINRTEKW